jgi:hypothetical protein
MLETLKEYDEKPSLCASDYCRMLHNLLYICDVVVEGRYEKEKKNLRLKFRGSENQRIIVSRDLVYGKINIINDDEI